MRTAICTLQQALTSEATSVVNQGVSVAERRGHTQVTPLHVASAMLSNSNGLLKKACLQCHSHPLQCKALELCFNVALNRLQASTPSHILGPQFHDHNVPSFSNALVAAFKRAQAHQRRGSIENQQHPILALKIDLEQLVISILDDPSVSRVMREAGFSSTQLKNRVEQSVSLEICSSNSPKETSKALGFGSDVSQITSPFSRPFDQIRHEDVNSVFNIMLKKNRNVVVVGESIETAESVARRVMDQIERGNISQGHYWYLKFVTFPLLPLRNLNKEKLEQKLVELKCMVKSYMGRGVVLYLSDLAWISEVWSNFYTEPIVVELKRLVGEVEDHGRLWLMGTSTFQTYMKCKIGQPSLETIWELQPFTIPVGSLSLSLNFDSDVRAEIVSSKGHKDGQVNKQLSCCAECLTNFHKEVQYMQKSTTQYDQKESSKISTLPSWLQKYGEENNRNYTTYNQENIKVGDLCKKWNSFCSSIHKYPPNYVTEKPFILSSSSSPCSSNSLSSNEFSLNLHKTNQSWVTTTFGPDKQSLKEYQFWTLNENSDHDGCESNVKEEPKPELLSNPNSSPNSASSSEVILEDKEHLQNFKEFNDQNIKILCDEMEMQVYWQKGIIFEIANTVLKCRSGLSQRKVNNYLKTKEDKEETWLFFLGIDSIGKEKIARILAKLIFGSQRNFISIGLSSFSSKTEENKNKRARNELGCSYIQRFGEAVNDNPHRVFFMEDIEQVDYSSQKCMKNAIESGRVTLWDGELVPLKDAIVIFSCQSGVLAKETSLCVSLDLNIALEDDIQEDSNVQIDSLLKCADRKVIFGRRKKASLVEPAC